MAHSASLANSSASQAATAASRRIRRNNIFTRLIEALQFSRRLEAERVLRRYHHLIADDSQGQPKTRRTRPR
jgi:hypothetical protein